MFDFSGSELVILAVVALVFIGPRDLPKALYALSKVVKTIKQMAAEFQSQVEEIAKSADVQDIGQKLRSGWDSFDLEKHVEKTIDPDNTLKSVTDLKSLPASASATETVSQEVSTREENLAKEQKEAEEKRLSILKDCPSILEPAKALRIYEERRSQKQRPACLPPEFSIHQGQRVIVNARDGES